MLCRTVTNQDKKEARPMIKSVAAVLKYISEGGPPQIKESTKLAQLTRQIRNIRRVIFSTMIVITLFIARGLHMRGRYYCSYIVPKAELV